MSITGIHRVDMNGVSCGLNNNVKCSIPGECCSVNGMCGTGAGYCTYGDGRSTRFDGPMIVPCGPNHNNAKCTLDGDCCSIDGVCGTGPDYCTFGDGRPTAYDGPAGVTCDSWLRSAIAQQSACTKASAPSDVTLTRCGPATNTMCPWRRGQDLCCVIDPIGRSGEGMCVPCAELDKDQYRDVYLWSEAKGWTLGK